MFFLGASLGSFLNATAYRVDNKKEYKNDFRIIAKRNSHCEYCKKELTWLELIPVLGYLIVGGRCSKCKKRISIYCPISEFLLGIATLLFYIHNVSFHLCIVLLFLFVLSYYDKVYRAIPKNMVHIFLGVCSVLFVFINLNLLSFVVTVVLVLFLFVLSLLMKKSFGMGDMLLLVGLGLVMEYRSFLVMFWFGILLALFCSICYSILRKKNLKGMKIPMVPFFAISFVVGALYGIYLYDLLFDLVSI